MQYGSAESLVEERVAQLAEITQRRNALLRQMYQMICRRQSVASVLVEDEEEEGLNSFLKRFDLRMDGLEVGSITNLDDSDLFNDSSLYNSSQSNPPPRGRYLWSERASRSRVPLYDIKSPPYVPVKQITSDTFEDINAERYNEKGLLERRHQPTPTLLQRPDDFDDEPDELDLLGNLPPFAKRRTTRVSPGAPFAPTAETSEAIPESNAMDRNELLEKNDSNGELVEGTMTQFPVFREVIMDRREAFSDISATHIEEPIPVEYEDAQTIDAPSIGLGAVYQQNATSDIEEALVVGEGLASLELDTTVDTQVLRTYQDEQGDAPNSLDEERIHSGIQDIPDRDESRLLTNATMQLSSQNVSFSPIPDKPIPLPVIVTASAPRIVLEKNFNFDVILAPTPLPSEPVSPSQSRHQIHFKYNIPPLKYLPLEYNRKARPTKLQRKREKEREKNEGRRDRDLNKDDWVPMGLNKWAATISANPVYKRVSRASKCLSTRDWAVAMSEIRLMRALERIEVLKREGRWGFRQPKKQRGVGGLIKTHWDHLMDEMKWMRIDFREERKWKMALAFNLSTAVLEWHSATSLEQRLERGICVRWTLSLSEQDVLTQNHPDITDIALMDADVDDPPRSLEVASKSSLLGVDYGSDDDDDEEEGEKTTPSIVDPLAPTAMIEDALDGVALQMANDTTNLPDIQPKTEDVDNPSAFNDSINANVSNLPLEESDTMLIDEKDSPAGLKPSSNDPVLGSKATPASSNDDVEPTTLAVKISTKISTYAPWREHVAYTADTQLFLEDLALSKLSPPSENLGGSEFHFDLSTIFPDLQPLGILDVPPVVTPSVFDGKRRSEKRSDRDDPTKRIEDTTYAKSFPVGEFMFSKPTLLGPLQPSKNWRNGRWATFEDSVAAEADGGVRTSDDGLNELFDSRSSNSPTSIMALQIQAAILKEKDPRKRGADHLWSSNDDALLKSLIDKYPNNWALISECFNASRLTISTDRRTPRDCLERWKDKWGLDPRQRPSESATVAEDTPPPTPSQMTTRGVKRLASASVSTPAIVGMVGSGEPRKRRRHALVIETIRKATKKRADSAQKALANQRKPPAIHETHAQYNKMTKHTPAELSRMKAEKEARDLQDLQLARKRQEDLNRQNNMLQANRMNIPQQGIPQQILSAQQTNGPGIVQSQRVPQIRSQVNISQQQRIGTPFIPAGNSRLSPQQLMQVQQVRAAAQQQTQQAQAQIAVSSQGQNINVNALAPSPHASIPPPNAVASPRPPSAQAHPLIQAAQPPGNIIPRQGGNAYYGLPAIANIRDLTQEQIHAALRIKLQQQQAQQQQGPAQLSSNNFPQQP